MTSLSVSPFFVKHMVVWVSFCLVAILMLVWDRKRLVPEWREYWRFLSWEAMVLQQRLDGRSVTAVFSDSRWLVITVDQI